MKKLIKFNLIAMLTCAVAFSLSSCNYKEGGLGMIKDETNTNKAEPSPKTQDSNEPIINQEIQKNKAYEEEKTNEPHAPLQDKSKYSISTLPEMLQVTILTYLHKSDICSMFRTNSSFSKLSKNHLVSKCMIEQWSFGPKQWKEYFGEIGDAPLLPADIEEILNAPCPYYQDAKKMGVAEMKKLGKNESLFLYQYWIDKVNDNKELKVRDSHFLTLVPKAVNGIPMTLHMLGELVRKPLKGTAANYSAFTIGKYFDMLIDKSYWVLMTRDVIPGSRYKDFEAQQKLIKANCCIPKIIEVAVGILMHHAKTGERLFSDAPCTYTHCEEVYENGFRLLVGGFDLSRLSIFFCYNDMGCRNSGVAGLRKF